VRFALLTSTPLSPTEGSGTFVAVDGLARGLGALGHAAAVRPLRLRTGFHTLDRWLYNAGVALRPPVGADLVYGVDLDGFLWARRRKLPFVVSLKGVIADELKNERGWVRVLLSVQARWERRNARRADLVLVPTRYSEGVARRLYDLEPSKLAVLPEPIDLDGWTARFVAAQARPRTGATVLCVARMYPRKRIVDLLCIHSRLEKFRGIEQIRKQNTIDEKAWTVAHLYRQLSDLARKCERALASFLRSFFADDDFDQFHPLRRIEKVQTDHAVGGTRYASQFANRQGRGICGEDRFRTGFVRELAEDFLFDVDLF